jgi:hypothetical protein
MTWSPADFNGLTASQFRLLATNISSKAASSKIGRFSVQNGNTIFVPAEFVVLERNTKLDSVVDGSKPYLELKDLIGDLPGQFGSLGDAQKFANETYVTEDSKVFLDKSMLISIVWTQLQLDENIAQALEQGHSNITVSNL